VHDTAGRARGGGGRASQEDPLLLADARTSGGLLVAGELPGAAVIGELVPRGEAVVVVR
jgi:selenide, water dikinase